MTALRPACTGQGGLAAQQLNAWILNFRNCRLLQADGMGQSWTSACHTFCSRTEALEDPTASHSGCTSRPTDGLLQDDALRFLWWLADRIARRTSLGNGSAGWSFGLAATVGGGHSLRQGLLALTEYKFVGLVLSQSNADITSTLLQQDSFCSRPSLMHTKPELRSTVTVRDRLYARMSNTSIQT